jgi:predicted  nucleic acid-binding Zn-ribbon protein
LKALIVEWNEVGHVPFKEKDKLYKEYKTASDAQFDRLNMDQASRRMDFFRANLEDMSGKGQQKLQSERKRLVRVYESLNSEIATFENNIGFFSGSSKNAAGLIKDMERKIAKLKEERELVVEKIKMLEETTK